MQENNLTNLESGIDELRRFQPIVDSRQYLLTLNSAISRAFVRKRAIGVSASCVVVTLAIILASSLPSIAAAGELRKAISKKFEFAVIKKYAVGSDGALIPMWSGWYSPVAIKTEIHYPGKHHSIAVVNKYRRLRHDLDTDDWKLDQGDFFSNDWSLRNLFVSNWHGVTKQAGVSFRGRTWDKYTVDQEEAKAEFYVDPEDGMIYWSEELIKDSPINVGVFPGTEHQILEIVYPESISADTFELDPPLSVVKRR